MKNPSKHHDELKASSLSDAAIECNLYSKSIINKLARSIATRKTGNCTSIDIQDLQIRCHAPKAGNRRISYEFYGTDPDDCFGFNYTKKQAVALVAEFALGQFWKAPIYREQWLEIADKAGVEVPEQRPIKPKDDIYYSPSTGRPTMAFGDKSVQQVLADRIVGIDGGGE